MAKVKRELSLFTFYDGVSLAGHFEKMAAKGWMISDISRDIWFTYKQIQPQRLKFGVTYFADADEYDITPSEERQAFEEFCLAAGWQRVKTPGQMQIFYNENLNALPLETDLDMTLDVIHSTMKNSKLPGIALLMFLSAANFFLRVKGLKINAFESLASYQEMLDAFLWLSVFITQCSFVGQYFSWYAKAVKIVKEYGFVPPDPTGRKINILRYFTPLITVILLIACGYSAGYVVAVVAASAILVGIQFLYPRFIRSYSTDKQRAKTDDMVITLIVAVLVFAVTFYTVDKTGIFSAKSGKQPVYTVENSTTGYEMNVYKDTLPVYIADITGQKPGGEYSYMCATSRTFLLNLTKCEQVPLPQQDKELPMLEYKILTPKNSVVYGWCLDSLLNEYDKYNNNLSAENRYRYKEQNIGALSRYGVQKIWQLTGGYNPQYTYVMDFSNTIIYIRSSREISRDNLPQITEKLI